MARDEQSTGNGNGSSGKSGRQDMSSARRARLRSLARQALPPDPYSKKQESEDPAASLGLEFLEKEDGGGQAAPTPPPQSHQPELWSTQPVNQQPSPQTQDPTSWSEPDYQAQQAQAIPVDPDYQQQQMQYQQPIADPNGYSYGQPIPDPGYQQAPPAFESFMHGSTEPPAFASNMISDAPPFNLGLAPDSPFQQAQIPDASSGQMPQPEPSYQYSEPVPHEQPQPIPHGLSGSYGEPAATAEVAPLQEPMFSTHEESAYGGAPPQSASYPDPAPAALAEPDYGQQSFPASYPSAQEAMFGQSSSSFPYSPPEPTYSPAADRDVVKSTFDIDYGDPDATIEEARVKLEPEIEATPVKWEVGTGEATAEELKTDSEPIAEAQTAPLEESVETPTDQVKEPSPSPRKRSRRKSDADEVEKDTEVNSDDESVNEKTTTWPKGEEDDQPIVIREEKKKKDSKQDDSNNESKSRESSSRAPEMQVVPVELLTKSQAEALEMLTSIDQALGICAMNLSSLQTTASEQTDVLRTLRETLQNQTFFELGLNLNTLMESMSAALEPMKAVGELVPAIDQLVSTMVTREDQEKEQRISPDVLVSGLVDQLGNGKIDPWTFKCAYMAVYPDVSPADLLHRLVELLGTQRMSGDLFRSAYEAINMADAPRRGVSTADGVREIEVIKEVEVVKEVEVIKVVQDEEILRQLEDLRRANEDLRSLLDDKDSDVGRRFEEREREFNLRLEERESELSRRIDERESEYAELLASKEQEIQETQEMLHSRFEEFNARYEEMVETVNQRDEELKVKEDELIRKESEISMLKTQLEELSEQYKDTVESLNKQLSSPQRMAEAQKISQQLPPVPGPAAAPRVPDDNKPRTSFFDQDSKGGAGAALFQKPVDTFSGMSQKPTGNDASMFGAPPAPGAPSGMSAPPDSPSVSFGGAPPTTTIQEQPSNQAVPKPVQTTPGVPGMGSGSYGSGVRAQVFEVIVRQALAGAPWREICAGPMSVNNITADEVEQEVKRREALLKK